MLIKRYHEGRQVVAVLQAACDDPDDPGVPSLADHNDSAFWHWARFDLLKRLIENRYLDLLALLVIGIKLLCERAKRAQVVASQQLCAQPRLH